MNYLIHDPSCFPLVRVRPEAMTSGYAFAWRAEMQRLLARREPFVLLIDSMTAGSVPDRAGVLRCEASESADDRRMRGAWLRAHRDTVGVYCRGLIVLETQLEKRVSTRLAELALTAGSGLRVIVIADRRVAAELVPVLLNGRGAVPAGERSARRAPKTSSAGTGVIRPARF